MTKRILALVMPATLGRILLLLPIFSAVAAHAGLKPGSKGYSGVCLAAIMSTYQCGTAVLPANAPNLVLAGAAERVGERRAATTIDDATALAARLFHLKLGVRLYGSR